MAERTFIVQIPPGIETPALKDFLSRVAPALEIAQWREFAADNVDTGDYLARLTVQDALRYPYGGDPDAVAVVNDSFYADWLENGRAGFHLPSHWTKWRQGKNGPYARVLFRVHTPTTAGGGTSTSRARGVMPAAVLARARQLEHGQRLTGFGDTYKQSKSYVFYRQVYPNFPDVLSDTEGYTWKASQYEGLMQAGMRNTPQGGTQSEYVTLRTIKPDSPGWYIPPTKPQHFAERTLTALSPQLQELAEAAAAQDIEAAIVNAAGRLIA